MLQQQNEASYSLQFQLTKEQLEELKKVNQDFARVVRGLNPEEQKRFMDSFLKANKAAFGKK